MATIVGIEGESGAVVAGDRRLTQAGTVESDRKRHVFDMGDVGGAAVGDSGGIDAFQRKLESEVQSYETEHGESIRIDRLVSIAKDIAATEGVEAIVTARDDDTAGKTARIRGIGTDGGVVTDATLAFGSGAQLALGVLEGRGQGSSLDDAEDLARKAIDAAADRDTGTGEDVDTYRLANDGDD